MVAIGGVLQRQRTTAASAASGQAPGRTCGRRQRLARRVCATKDILPALAIATAGPAQRRRWRCFGGWPTDASGAARWHIGAGQCLRRAPTGSGRRSRIGAAAAASSRMFRRTDRHRWRCTPRLAGCRTDARSTTASMSSSSVRARAGAASGGMVGRLVSQIDIRAALDVSLVPSSADRSMPVARGRRWRFDRTPRLGVPEPLAADAAAVAGTTGAASGSVAGASSTSESRALNASAQRPQRTQPSRRELILHDTEDRAAGRDSAWPGSSNDHATRRWRHVVRVVPLSRTPAVVFVLPTEIQPGACMRPAGRRSVGSGCRPAPGAPVSAEVVRTAAAPAASAAWPGCWPAPGVARQRQLRAGPPEVARRWRALSSVAPPRRVDVDRIHVGGAMQRSRHGQDARTAAVVEHAPEHASLRPGPRPGWRSSAGTCAWSGACRCRTPGRDQPDHPPGRSWWLVPGGHDPERRRHRNRVELAFASGAPSPARPRPGSPAPPGRRSSPAPATAWSRLPPLRAFEQRAQRRAVPARFRCRHAGFTEQRVLFVGVGVGVFHRHRQRVEFVGQRVAHAFDQRLRRAASVRPARGGLRAAMLRHHPSR